MKFPQRNTQAQQREAVAQGRSLLPYRLRYSGLGILYIGKLLKTYFSPVTVASPLPQSEARRFRYKWFLKIPFSIFLTFYI
ncbi:MAG: hypothetical protein LBJ00_09815 [Planctomycetaceae bacterium]|nr:hypothetical protein [Planctomycetaceae bacterium]